MSKENESTTVGGKDSTVRVAPPSTEKPTTIGTVSAPTIQINRMVFDHKVSNSSATTPVKESNSK